uniref:Uncharacterized protein n=1 Tax=Parascaris univalens TaxID=6257 RepID=A0A915B8U8_PARUN
FMTVLWTKILHLPLYDTSEFELGEPGFLNGKQEGGEEAMVTWLNVTGLSVFVSITIAFSQRRPVNEEEWNDIW